MQKYRKCVEIYPKWVNFHYFRKSKNLNFSCFKFTSFWALKHPFWTKKGPIWAIFSSFWPKLHYFGLFFTVFELFLVNFK